MGLTGHAVHRADSGVLSDLSLKTSRPLDSGQKTPSSHAEGRQVCQALDGCPEPLEHPLATAEDTIGAMKSRAKNLAEAA